MKKSNLVRFQTVSQRIRWVREILQISQAAAAARASIPQQAWARYESGATPKHIVFRNMANALRVHYEWLQTGELLEGMGARHLAQAPNDSDLEKLSSALSVTTEFLRKFKEDELLPNAETLRMISAILTTPEGITEAPRASSTPSDMDIMRGEIVRLEKMLLECRMREEQLIRENERLKISPRPTASPLSGTSKPDTCHSLAKK